MGYPVWLYHKYFNPDVFDSEEIPEMRQYGWRESPQEADLVEYEGEDEE